MPEPPKILTRRKVETSRLFKVEAAELEFSNGERREYEYLVAGEHGAVIIVALTRASEVLIIQEYGIGVEAHEWGLPKGKVDAGETLGEAANRELQEEAGYGAARLEVITSISQSPSYMQHRTHIVLARELYPQTAIGDEPEPLTVAKFDLADLAMGINRFDITEARSIAALYMVRDWLAAEQLARDRLASKP